MLNNYKSKIQPAFGTDGYEIKVFYSLPQQWATAAAEAREYLDHHRR